VITCPECEHENNDSAVTCANCGSYLSRPTRHALDEVATSELEAMLDQLDLPDEEAATPPDARAGQGALATHPRAVPVESAHPLSGRTSPAIRVARIAVAVAIAGSMFAPWGRDEGAIANGWVFAFWFTLGSCGMLAFLYAGLFLYALSLLQSDHRNWVSWVPRYVKPFLPKGIVEVINRPWVFFWVTRLSLLLWLLLGPYFILSTNIRDWPLNITWGAWLFLAGIALANSIESVSLMGWGRETSSMGWMSVGAIWICLSLVLLPVGIAISGIEPGTMSKLSADARPQLSAEELLTQYQGGKRAFMSAVLQSARLTEADLPEIKLQNADLRGADLRGANLHDAVLTQTYLSGADMSGADLRRANLSEARLSSADLGGANLTGANLRGADLSNSDMAKANLHKANLSEAKLFWADLSGADLSEADLTGASLRGANLTGATITDEQLAQAETLEGATLPDGTVHE
jgi:uncharacterized protein YjbI with pentapeptide repeats